MKTFVDKSKEETGKAPDCTGAVLKIKRVTRQAVKTATSEFHGCAQYVVQLQVVQPKGAAGITVFDRIRVGTPDDKEAQKAETWEVSEGGPARLRRLLSRSGTALTKDDEEWMADAEGRTVVAPITNRGDFTNVGLYYRENDKDAPVIGLAGPGGKPAKAKRAPVAEDDDEADEPATPESVDEEEEEKPAKGKAKKPAPVEEDEEDDDEEEEPVKKKAVAAKKAAKKPADDEDDD